LIQPITVMKRVCWFFLLILLIVYLPGFTQEEGVLLKKQRVSKGKSVYLSGGQSFVFGNSSGDYSSGLNIEAGYLKRLNSFISIGPSLSYSSFNYDESISDSFGDASATGNNVYYNDADYGGAGCLHSGWRSSVYNSWPYRKDRFHSIFRHQKIFSVWNCKAIFTGSLKERKYPQQQNYGTIILYRPMTPLTGLLVAKNFSVSIQQG
jgi:hypothetical protein